MKKTTAFTILCCVTMICLTAILVVLFVSKKDTSTDLVSVKEEDSLEDSIKEETPIEETEEQPVENPINPPDISIVGFDPKPEELTQEVLYEDTYVDKVDEQWLPEVDSKADAVRVQGFISSVCDFPEAVVIDEITFTNNGIVMLMFHIKDSDLAVSFEGDEIEGLHAPFLQCMSGDHSPIIWDNGIPEDADRVYEILGEAGYGYSDTIIRSNYVSGDDSIVLRFSDGHEETVQL